MENMTPQSWVALYAAIVSTSALLLNLKTWLDSGIKLKVSLIPDGLIMGGDPQFDEKDLIIVNVINRGDAPTMITNLILMEMPTWWARFRKRAARYFVVANPQLKGYPHNVPSELGPAKTWTGVVRHRQDVIGDIRNGHFFVAVHASHRDKPYIRIIPKAKEKPSPPPAATD
jgi:hypothetical protein